ncbi:MAG: TA system VapC family ribonuclease toxin [Myxococcaceae bacterium]|nr:TA system VapC family ribonuclease toxin [Myxococcaceae bacterium]
MRAFDTNLLVYAHRSESPFHQRAASALRAAAEGRAAWAIPWPCVHEFIGIVTNPKIVKTPTPLEAAIAQVDAWLSSPTLVMLSEEREGYWPLLTQLLRAGRIQGARVHDARVAALARLHGVDELLTADRDFSRFSGLNVRNPLVEGP